MKKPDGTKRIFSIIADGVICAVMLFLFTASLVIIIYAATEKYEEYKQYKIEQSGIVQDITPLPYTGKTPEKPLYGKIIAGLLDFNIAVLPIIFICAPITAQSVLLLIFNNSFGTKIFKIKIKNSDGTNPKKTKYFEQLLLGLVFGLVGIIFYIVDIVYCIKNKRTISDNILKLQAYDK